jgi:hypothetical protein
LGLTAIAVGSAPSGVVTLTVAVGLVFVVLAGARGEVRVSAARGARMRTVASGPTVTASVRVLVLDAVVRRSTAAAFLACTAAWRSARRTALRSAALVAGVVRDWAEAAAGAFAARLFACAWTPVWGLRGPGLLALDDG